MPRIWQAGVPHYLSGLLFTSQAIFLSSSKSYSYTIDHPFPQIRQKCHPGHTIAERPKFRVFRREICFAVHLTRKVETWGVCLFKYKKMVKYHFFEHKMAH